MLHLQFEQVEDRYLEFISILFFWLRIFNSEEYMFQYIIVFTFFSLCIFNANASGPIKDSAWRWLDGQYELFDSLNKSIWAHSEVGLEEVQSSIELQKVLVAHGFEVESGVADMPTAFVATYGLGGPIIGILAEYDALPGVSQANTSFQKIGPNPYAGHACGHSVFGTGSVAAALAIKELILSNQIKGTIKLYGTPAEETGIGKVYMLKDGYFKGDDVIFSWHALDRTAVSYNDTKALVNVKFNFSGTASHASAAPWSGRSALDAVELMNSAVNMMREHMRPDVRVHYVITEGGGQPNVVPPSAEVWYYIRANKFEDVEYYFDWVRTIALSAAAMTQTELSNIVIQSEVHEKVSFRKLSEIMQRNIEIVGLPEWSARELEFARDTQRNFLEQNSFRKIESYPALSSRIEPLGVSPAAATASTDIGDVSWFVPTGGLAVASYAYGLPIHSWPVVAATGTSIGTKALITAAKAIVGTAVELYLDPQLLSDVKNDWSRSRGTSAFRTLIPAEQKAPVNIR